MYVWMCHVNVNTWKIFQFFSIPSFCVLQAPWGVNGDVVTVDGPYQVICGFQWLGLTVGPVWRALGSSQAFVLGVFISHQALWSSQGFGPGVFISNRALWSSRGCGSSTVLSNQALWSSRGSDSSVFRSSWALGSFIGFGMSVVCSNQAPRRFGGFGLSVVLSDEALWRSRGLGLSVFLSTQSLWISGGLVWLVKHANPFQCACLRMHSDLSFTSQWWRVWGWELNIILPLLIIQMIGFKSRIFLYYSKGHWKRVCFMACYTPFDFRG